MILGRGEGLSAIYSRSYAMRDYDTHQAGLFTYILLEARIPVTHLLRLIRQSVVFIACRPGS